MVVIVWAGWKGRTGQLWTWIYTAWPWLTAGTVFLEQKTMLPAKKLAVACAFACTRAGSRVGPAYSARWASTMTAFTRNRRSSMRWKRQRGGSAFSRSPIPSLELMFYLSRVYTRVQQLSWFSCYRERRLGIRSLLVFSETADLVARRFGWWCHLALWGIF